ncbi:glycoside hydrolase family 31 protein [Massilia sp. TWR1-2-2]|uniref:glycoside hydrolase family 31 protein n=1 Tax=Massilia sp. TWR1-2-2 TaxID=2804584 RepID=UPI003CEF6DB6
MSSSVLHQADFSRFAQLRLLACEAHRARFDADGVALTVSAVDGRTLRLTLGTTSLPDYALLQPTALPPALTLAQIDGGWHIDCGVLRLELRGNPLRLSLYRDAELVLESITDQHFKGRTRLPAFGRAGANLWCAAFALSSDSAVYGLGEKYGALDKRGQLVRGRTEDALGVNTELSYKNIPFCWSPDGWGLLAHTPGVVRHGVGFGQWSHRSYVLEVEDDCLDLFLFGGEPAAIIDSYTALTGRAAIPPLWSLGMWLSRAYYATPEEAIETAAELRKRKIPCDVITLDGRAAWEVRTRFDFKWDKSRFADAAKSLSALKAHQLKVCLWEYPCVSVHNPLFGELEKKGWLLKKADGSAYVFDWVKDPTDDPFGAVLTPLPPSALLDFTHPDAARFWADSHDALFDDGVDVMKTDFGEQVEDDMHAHNGDTGRRLHNVYPLLYNGCVYDATQRYNDAHGRGAAMVWGRDGFIGSQRYPMQWGGDPQTDWEGMAASIRGALSYGMSGVPYYSSDVGGFYGARQPDPELYLRWTANAIFCSHFRYHGIGVREPWGLGEEAETVARQWLLFRYRLIPYIMGTMQQAAGTGLPLMRAMALAYPHDRAARAFEMQYMFGDALLVAPIIAAGGATQVWFPAGSAWYDLGTGERIEGGQARQVHKAIDQLPVYGREGHMLCLGAEVQHTGEIDLANPVDQVWLFGQPRHAPTVMNQCVMLELGRDGAWLNGVTAAQCLPAAGIGVQQRGARVRIS